MFTDRVLKHDIAVDLGTGFGDMDFEILLRELPADAFLDLSLCFRRETDEVLPNAVRFWKHEFQRLVFGEEDFCMRHLLLREKTFQLGIPNPFSSGRQRKK